MDNMIKSLPSQKKLRKQRTTPWWKESIDACIQLAIDNYSANGIRDNMISNYYLWASQLDTDDIERTLNPFNIRGANFPAKPQHYPIGNQKLATLIGEEKERNFSIRAFVSNPEAVSEKEKRIMDDVIDKLLIYTNPNITKDLDERKLKEALDKLSKWKNYDAQDIREKFANSIIQYAKNIHNIDFIKNQGFKDLALSAHEIYNIDIIGKRIKLRKCNPLHIYTYGLGESYKIEDADIIVEDCYMSIGSVIDEFYEYLTSKDTTDLEEAAGYGKSHPENSMFTGEVGSPTLSLTKYFSPLSPTNIEEIPFDLDSFPSESYDSKGNIRVTRVTWKSRRKLKVAEYKNEDGEAVTKIWDEEFIPDPNLIGLEVKEYWVNEWLEAIRLGADKYIRMRVKPIQFRYMDSLMLGGSGYVGTILRTNNGIPVSLMDRLKPFSYMYDYIMMKLELLLARAHGPETELDLAKIPDGYTMDHIMYFSQVMGYRLLDSFKEGEKGASKNIMAGNFNTTGRVLNPDFNSFVSMYINILTLLENEMGNVTGVTKQREGNVGNRETMGGIERAVTQSTYNTEELFMTHEDTIKRVYDYLVIAYKQLYINEKPLHLQYALDDGTPISVMIDGEQFASADYDTIVGKDRDVDQIKQIMRESASNMLQSRMITFSQFVKTYRDPSNASTLRKLEQFEEELLQKEKQSSEEQNKIEMAKLQDKLADRDMIKYKVDQDNLTQLQIAAMSKGRDKESVQEEQLKSERLEALELKKIESKERMQEKEMSSKEKIEDKKEIKKKQSS